MKTVTRMIEKKILYGVQGTGNGHLSRARLMAAEFRKHNVSVQYLFSGRKQSAYFDMDVFDHPLYKSGLTFATHMGRVNRLRSLLKSKPLAYLRDVSSLRTDRYDLVISDFEPITARAARRRNTRSLAIGHQYALCENSPLPAGDYISKWILKRYAPANSAIGFHWHPYQNNILPPMIDTSLASISTGQDFTLVYLPFEDLPSTVELLQQLPNEHFVVYSALVSIETQRQNVSIYPLSSNGFKHHLQRCSRIICNTGFELVSEALFLGKPVLTKPLEGQFEQSANALTLKKLQLANVTRALNILNLDSFLSHSTPNKPIHYPDVAKALVNHCLEGAPADLPELSRQLWAQVDIEAEAPASTSQLAAA